MSEVFTKSMARNIYYGGSVFFALLFLAIDAIWDRRTLLFVIGGLAAAFIVTDFVRLIRKAEIRLVFKRKEANRFSSMTTS